MMHLSVEKGGVLSVCANPAWQKTLIFPEFRLDSVNRAQRKLEFGGGKGVNVVRALRLMGYPVTLATFLGGQNGERLQDEILKQDARLLSAEISEELRNCTTIIDQAWNSATEVIEPSPMIPEMAVSQLEQAIINAIPSSGSIAICGSRSPGVSVSFYAHIARAARENKVPLLLDDVNEVEKVLETGGVTILKINSGELKKILDHEKAIPDLAMELFELQPVSWLAVTNGPLEAWLFCREPRKAWRFSIPKIPLKYLVSAIGGGDTVAAIMAMRLAQAPSVEAMPQFFAEALAAASASCRTEIPSVFNQELMQLPSFKEINL